MASSLSWIKGLRRQRKERCKKQVRADSEEPTAVRKCAVEKDWLDHHHYQLQLQAVSPNSNSKSFAKKLAKGIHKVYSVMANHSGRRGDSHSHAQWNITLHTYVPSPAACSLLVA